MADDEVEALARPPGRDVALLVPVALAGVRRDVDGAVARRGPVAPEPASPDAGARPDVEDGAELDAEPLGEAADAAREPGNLARRVGAPRAVIEAPEVLRVEAGWGGHGAPS